jgi:flagellar protein FlaF
MTAHAFNARTAYGVSSDAIGSDKDIEVQVFQRAIAKLSTLRGPGFSLTGEAAEILSENLRLWDMLAVDLLNKDNPLDDKLRAELLSLGRFVRTHTHGILAGNGSVDVLVDINTAILKGLLGQPGEASASATQAA